MTKREEIQNEVVNIARTHNYNGVLVLDPGSGKSKVAIECIKEGKFKNVLITSPRSNLKNNWLEELRRWGIQEIEPYLIGSFKGIKKIYWNFGGNIELANIQTCYKWDEEQIKQLDLIIYDEIHTCGLEYFKLIEIAREYNIPVLGLTGTPTKDDKWKSEVLYKTLPILYEYYDAEQDGITNKIQYWVYEYELSNDFKVITGTKNNKWLVGEKKQYEYLSDQYEKAKKLMFLQGAENYFEQSLQWMQSKTATKEQKDAGTKFFYAVRNRKEFLWNLESSKQIALQIKSCILQGYYFTKINSEWCVKGFEPDIKKINKNKVLLFSELTSQAEKLSEYSIHSNNGKSAKECEKINKELLDKFNSGEIRELSSCLSLTLGLNLVDCNWAIFESYSSSNTNAIQKSKRLARLKSDQVANVVIIKAKNTQMDNWFSEAFKGIEYKLINNINDLKV